MKVQKCKECGHPRKSHSIQGCLHDGMCIHGCQVKYMEKNKFKEEEE